MTESSKPSGTFESLLPVAYGKMLAEILKPNPILEQWREESRQRHEQWLAGLSRWGRVKYELRCARMSVADKWNAFRYRLAAVIYPGPMPDGSDW